MVVRREAAVGGAAVSCLHVMCSQASCGWVLAMCTILMSLGVLILDCERAAVCWPVCTRTVQQARRVPHAVVMLKHTPEHFSHPRKLFTPVPQCKYEFCWLCQGDWKEHGERTGGFYNCNR